MGTFARAAAVPAGAVTNQALPLVTLTSMSAAVAVSVGLKVTPKALRGGEAKRPRPASFAGVSDLLERDAWRQRLAEWHESSGTIRPTDNRFKIRMARRNELLLRRQFAHALLAIALGRSTEGLHMAFPFIA